MSRMLEIVKFITITDKTEMSFAVSFSLVHIREMFDGVEAPFQPGHVSCAPCRVKYALPRCHVGQVVDRVKRSFRIHV